MGVRRTIHIPNDDLWLVEVIDRIIEGKRELKFPPSNFSFELLRLAKNGYKRAALSEELPGGEYDRMFGVADDDSGSRDDS